MRFSFVVLLCHCILVVQSCHVDNDCKQGSALTCLNRKNLLTNCANVTWQLETFANRDGNSKQALVCAKTVVWNVK